MQSQLSFWTKKMSGWIFQVLMKDVATPVPQQEVRAVIKKCLENAALVNYERLSQEAKIEGKAVHSASLLIPLIQPHVKVHLLE